MFLLRLVLLAGVKNKRESLSKLWQRFKNSLSFDMKVNIALFCHRFQIEWKSRAFWTIQAYRCGIGSLVSSVTWNFHEVYHDKILIQSYKVANISLFTNFRVFLCRQFNGAKASVRDRFDISNGKVFTFDLNHCFLLGIVIRERLGEL